MRALSGPIWDLWNSGGPFLGRDKPHGRVTVEFGWLLRASVGPVGDRPAEKLPIRWFQRADQSQVETELPNIKTIHIERSIDQDAATCDIDVYNTRMLPQGLLELGDPGYFTFGRGSHPDATARWGHTANEWSTELGPNALIRTYEGYGGWNPDGTPMAIGEAIAAGHLWQTGVWLVDEARPESQDNMLHLKLRDAAKLAIDQPIYPPLVPAGLYPLQYARFFYRDVHTPYVAYGNAAGGIKMIVGIIPDAAGNGYWLAGDDGGVFTYGDNWFHGSLGGELQHDGIGIARSFGKEGYWFATADGTVFAFGDAVWHGGHAPTAGETMVAIEAIQNTSGYYLCDTAGHVYAMGGAIYHGGGPGTSPIAAMAVMPDGSGYWLMDDTGHVYAYGAAGWYGNGDPSTLSLYTAIESTPTGLGYYLTDEKGHVYTGGDAVYQGGTSGIRLNDPIADIALRPDGAGYWLVAQDGGVFTFGPINFFGALPGELDLEFAEDGNYFDYADIVKDLLLWCGFWLYDGGVSPDVFGNIESTGIYDTMGLIPIDTFDKKAPMDAINTIKEIVGYITWVDADGGFHFESPNWWNEGNFMPDGSRTSVLPQVDEKVQLISYGVSADDKSARDRVVITNIDPALGSLPVTPDAPGSVTTTVVPITASALRGLLKPAIWVNYIFSSENDQQVMAQLLGNQLMFLQRVGSVVCWANPCFEVNDQVRIWERQTDEVYDHYVRGITTDHDLDTGQYTMQLTTHWLGRDWSGPGPTRNVLAGGARSAEACGLPEVSGGGAVINASGFQTGNQFGTPLVSTLQTVTMQGGATGEAEGLPEVGFLVAASGAATGAGFGQPTLLQQQVIRPAALSSSGAFGNPTVVGPQTVTMSGLTSSEAGGQPTTTQSGVTAYAAAVLVDGPSGFWKTDESSGTVLTDWSGNAHDGTYNGGYTQSEPNILPYSDAASALMVGTGYLSVPDNAAWSSHAGASGTMTLEAIIKPTSLVDNAFFFTKSSNPYEWGLNIMADGSLAARVWTNVGGNVMQVFAPAGTIQANVGYHVAATYDRAAALLILYVNGVEVARATTASGTSSDTGATVRMGVRGDGSGVGFTGYVQDFAYYPTVLSAARILAHYQAAVPASQTLTAGIGSRAIGAFPIGSG